MTWHVRTRWGWLTIQASSKSQAREVAERFERRPVLVRHMDALPGELRAPCVCSEERP